MIAGKTETKRTGRKTWITAALALVLCCTVLLAVPCAAETGGTTTVMFPESGVNIYGDATVYSWGYTTLDSPGTVWHEHHTVFLQDGGSTVITVAVPALSELIVTSEHQAITVDGGTVTVSEVTGGVDIYLTGKLPDTVVVTFDSNGGTHVDSQTVARGSTVTEPAAPSRSSYSFQGWYFGSEKWDFAKPVYEDMTLTASWRYNGGGGGGGGGSVTPQKEEQKTVTEITIIVDSEEEVTVPVQDQNGNIVDLPVEKLTLSDTSDGTVYLKDMTEYYNSLTITPSLKDTMRFIDDYRIETIEEAIFYGIPVYENYIGGNGHAPILTEDTSTIDPVKFWKVIEITTDVEGGKLQEIIFSVPLAVLREQGYTVTDVVLYHGVMEEGKRIWYPLVTTQEWFDDTYVYYKAVTDGASPFGILFLKDSTCVMPVSSTTESTPSSPEPVATPLGVAGVLAGMIGAGAVMMRRK